MQLIESKQMGTVKAVSGCVREWRKYSHDLTTACVAAHHYAKKQNAKMVVIAGNSYGAAVRHIVRFDDDFVKFAPADKSQTVAVVYPCGKVMQATASK